MAVVVSRSWSSFFTTSGKRASAFTVGSHFWLSTPEKSPFDTAIRWLFSQRAAWTICKGKVVAGRSCASSVSG